MTAAAGAAGQIPNDPGIDRAEKRLALRRPFARAGDFVEKPGELERGKIGRERQSRLCADQIAQPLRRDPVDGGLRARIHPDDRVMKRRAGRRIPQDRRLALIGDADGREVAGRDLGLGQRRRDHGLRIAPNLGGVMFDPAGAGIDLPVLALRLSDDPAADCRINDEAGARRALIERPQEFGHS